MESAKVFQKYLIGGSFNAALSQGVIVGGHRYATRSTIDDLRLLLDYMQIKGTEPAPVKDADGIVSMLLKVEVQATIDALIVYGVECWIKKGQLEYAIDQAQTISAVEAIIW